MAFIIPFHISFLLEIRQSVRSVSKTGQCCIRTRIRYSILPGDSSIVLIWQTCRIRIMRNKISRWVIGVQVCTRIYTPGGGGGVSIRKSNPKYTIDLRKRSKSGTQVWRIHTANKKISEDLVVTRNISRCTSSLVSFLCGKTPTFFKFWCISPPLKSSFTVIVPKEFQELLWSTMVIIDNQFAIIIIFTFIVIIYNFPLTILP